MNIYYIKNKVIIINWKIFRKNILNNIIIPLSKYLSYILIAIILAVVLFVIGRLFSPVNIGIDNKVEEYSIINIIIFIFSIGTSIILLDVAIAIFIFIIKWSYLHIFTTDYMAEHSSIHIYDKCQYQELLNKGYFKEIN